MSRRCDPLADYMKNKGSIFLLLTANFVSAVSQGMSMIAIPWYFTQTEGMKLFGWLYALTNFLALFWVPYSGTLIDRFERRKVLMTVMATLGCIILGVGLFGYYSGQISGLVVASVFMLTFLNYNIHYPALYALVQEMTETRYYEKIASIIEIQGQTATISAGALAALLLAGTAGGKLELLGLIIHGFPEIAPWEIYEIFILDGVTYFLGFGILAMIKYRPVETVKKISTSIRQRLALGVAFLKDHPKILIFGLASYAVFVTVLIEGFYLMAPYVVNHLEASASVYAAGEMMYSIGALFAGFSIQYLFRRIRLTDSIIFMTIAVAGAFFIQFVCKSVLIFYLAGVVQGLCNSGIRIQRVTFLFSTIPNDLYGRVNSIFNMGNIVIRITLLLTFSMTFFQTDNNVIYCMLIQSVFLTIAVLVLVLNRKEIINEQLNLVNGK